MYNYLLPNEIQIPHPLPLDHPLGAPRTPARAAAVSAQCQATNDTVAKRYVVSGDPRATKRVGEPGRWLREYGGGSGRCGEEFGRGC